MLMRSQRNNGTSNPHPVYRSRLSKKHRLVASLIIAGVAGGIFANCRASEITGPALFRQEARMAKAPGMAKASGVAKSMIVNEPNARFDTPPGTTEQNPCDGSMLLLEGTTRMSLHSSISETGQTHMYVRTRTTGEARSAAEVLTEDDMWSANSDDFTEVQAPTLMGSATETTITSHDVFVNKGTKSHFVRHNTFHVTISASGEMNAKQDKPVMRCKS